MPSDVTQLDEARLTDYLSQYMDGFEGPLTAKKFSDGQSNPTYMIKAASGPYVLRRKPPGVLLKSAHAVDREYRVMQALRDTGVPVAKMGVLCEDENIIGSMFYIMEYLDGRVLWDATLPEFSKADRAATYAEMCKVLAQLHKVDIDAVGLSDFGKPGNYYERQISRWGGQYRASETEVIPAMDALLEWLPANLPADDGRVSLVHGDYRLDNLMFHASEPRIIGVLDWELSTLGHPFADLAYQCMQLRLMGAEGGLGDLDREALGIPSEEAYVAQYCEHLGIDGIDNWNFYVVFCFFRLAAILQGVKKRALDGNASSAEALERSKNVAPLAEYGFNMI
ncbi:MAG: aminoglycoside phosphotransferase (APT) family kinase protein [Halieaceae bacterium]|jgi:aminoglycoside phosphotransferase (APT) family kinase protein